MSGRIRLQCSAAAVAGGREEVRGGPSGLGGGGGRLSYTRSESERAQCPLSHLRVGPAHKATRVEL